MPGVVEPAQDATVPEAIGFAAACRVDEFLMTVDSFDVSLHDTAAENFGCQSPAVRVEHKAIGKGTADITPYLNCIHAKFHGLSRASEY